MIHKRNFIYYEVATIYVYKINHLLRTVPSEIILNQLGKFDEMSDPHSLELSILHSPIPDDAWSQAVLSFSYGGLGFGRSEKDRPCCLYCKFDYGSCL